MRNKFKILIVYNHKIVKTDLKNLCEKFILKYSKKKY